MFKFLVVAQSLGRVDVSGTIFLRGVHFVIQGRFDGAKQVLGAIC